jgi:hypothetical protein
VRIAEPHASSLKLYRPVAVENTLDTRFVVSDEQPSQHQLRRLQITFIDNNLQKAGDKQV